MKEIEGDLIKLAKEGEFNVIIHGCNCHCKMGSGIAKQIKKKCRAAYLVDQKTISGDKSKLGKITYALISNKNEHTYTVVNAYTQYDYNKYKINIDYDALRSCFKEIKKQFSGKRIGIPLIGAGLAGGNWNKISDIIEEEMEDENITLVKYNG